MTLYRVTGPCLANVPTAGPLGEVRQTLYLNTVFDGSVVSDELLAMWQERGLAEPVDTGTGEPPKTATASRVGKKASAQPE